MVTSLAGSQQHKRPILKQNPTNSEQASSNLALPPKADSNILPRSEMQAKPRTNNPFLSSNTTEGWSTDDESGSSSGQDEFHLERYSQEADRKTSMAEPHRRVKLGSRSKKTRRPDLNIVTELPGSQARACEPGIVIEEVRAKKIATTRPKSVVSAKAEHVHAPFPPHRRNGLADLKETARLRHERNKTQRDLEGQDMPHELPSDNNQIPAANTSRLRDRSHEKPVIIGISIPRDDAANHGSLQHDESAITLRTPSIVVTPADADASFSKSLAVPGARPVSSLYSTAVSKSNNGPKESTPPLPPVPDRFNNFSRPYGKTSGGPELQDGDIGQQRDSMDSWEQDDVEGNLTEDPRRFSSESHEQILPSATNPNHHKSQGWWNLMLSPMLSRAGTQKSTTSRGPRKEPPVPPLPSASEKRRSRSTTMDSQISPETPRRLGLASARASTWSRWATWEKQKDHPFPSPEEAVPEMVQPASKNEGLAAEYYRACAIEQLSGEKYFECQHHSCEEKLPALHSIFDERQLSESPRGHGVYSAGVVVAGSHGHQRDVSGTTNAVSPDELSPNIREADTAAIVKARTIESKSPKLNERTHKDESAISVDEIERSPSPIPIPMPSPGRSQARYPNIAAIVPPPAPVRFGATVTSPGPISPDMQRSMTAQGAVPMSEMRSVSAETQSEANRALPPTMVQNYFNQPERPLRHDSPASFHIHNPENKPSPMFTQMPIQHEQPRGEDNKEAKEEKPSIFARLKSCMKSRKVRVDAVEDKKKKRRWAILIFIVLLLMIVAIVALATQLTRRGDRTPTQQQWLNLTGYPPMPTGISTIIQPNLVQSQSGCVSPSNMWSCALPKENQKEVSPNQPDQPNFRFEIKFRNGTVPSNMTIPLEPLGDVRERKRANDPFTNELFTPNPPPPSRADQIFLGNTTDNITESLFEGEDTPFFMTFIPAFPIDPNDPSIANQTDIPTSDDNSDRRRSLPTDSLDTALDQNQLHRRQTNLSSAIPPPSSLPDGSASPANLLPTEPQPFAQPIKLYNRGLDDEHYGFYMYFDKSIFLGVSAPVAPDNTNTTSDNTSDAEEAGDDTSGGADRNQARARCTFTQTRFLVKLYTSPSFIASSPLLGAINTTTPSAINYIQPGSFPYPATVSLDRHGGNVNKKLVYCYGMNELQVLDDANKSVIREDRAVGGSGLINAAPGLVSFEGEGEEFDQGAGGIDGGSGGCGCEWANFS